MLIDIDCTPSDSYHLCWTAESKTYLNSGISNLENLMIELMTLTDVDHEPSCT